MQNGRKYDLNAKGRKKMIKHIRPTMISFLVFTLILTGCTGRDITKKEQSAAQDNITDTEINSENASPSEEIISDTAGNGVGALSARKRNTSHCSRS